MTDLEYKDKVIEVPLITEEKEEETLGDIKGLDEIPDDMNNVLEELNTAQKELHGQNNYLAELRRRVELTENNMYLHMHSVGTLRHCLENGKAKTSKASDIIKELQKSERQLFGRKDIKKIRAEVDRELGIKPAQNAKIAMTHLGMRKIPATKHGIMNSLIHITGTMTEFSNNIKNSCRMPGINFIPLKKYT